MSVSGLIMLNNIGNIMLVIGRNGKYSFPKGKFEKEKDRNNYECARREFFEETGLVGFIYKLCSTPIIEHTDTGNVSCKYYYCLIDRELSDYQFIKKTDPDDEIVSIGFYTKEEIEAIPDGLFYRRRKNIAFLIIDLFRTNSLTFDDEDRFLLPWKQTKISKAISSWLRHHLDEFITSTKDGYVLISELLDKLNSDPRTVFTIIYDDVVNVSRHCFKQRIQIEGDRIRCVQGHSSGDIDDDSLMELLTEPITDCYHATDKKSLKSIIDSGLNKMGRMHIHFTNDPTMLRKGKKIMVGIKMEEAMNDGIKFYRAANGIILSPGINGVIPYSYLTIHRNK